jgi:hypothetical protein
VGWAFFYMFVILKIPVVAAIWLVWWASRAPEPAGGADTGGGQGGSHPRIRPPRPPRRGPHAEPPPRAPARVRTARGRTLLPAAPHR